MNAVRAIWKDGKIVPANPVDWPDGCEVLIEPIAEPNVRIGISEGDWSDDPAALADWASWLATLQPLEFTHDEASAMARFEEQMRQYNMETVRRQMEDLACEGKRKRAK